MLKDILALDVFKDLVVEAGSKAAHLRLLLAAQVIRQVHHFLNLLLAVLAVARVKVRGIPSRLGLSMKIRNGCSGYGRLFFDDLLRLLRLELFDRGFEDLLGRGHGVPLLDYSLPLLLR